MMLNTAAEVSTNSPDLSIASNIAVIADNKKVDALFFTVIELIEKQ